MRWNRQQHNLYQVFFDKQLVLWTSIWLENWFSFLLLFSVDISLCLSSLRLWAHASRVFQSNQKCPTSFWSRQHDFVWPWKFQHSVEWDSSPSNSLSWFSKLACGYQGRLQGCRHIWSNLSYRKLADDPTVRWQMESFAYSLVTRSIDNPAIIMQICDFNFVCEILEYVWSTFKRLSSLPDFHRFVQRESSKRFFYTNNFGKGNGLDMMEKNSTAIRKKVQQADASNIYAFRSR